MLWVALKWMRQVADIADVGSFLASSESRSITGEGIGLQRGREPGSNAPRWARESRMLGGRLFHHNHDNQCDCGQEYQREEYGPDFHFNRTWSEVFVFAQVSRAVRNNDPRRGEPRSSGKSRRVPPRDVLHGLIHKSNLYLWRI